MSDQLVIEIVRQAFYTVLIISGPILLIGMIVGLIISIFQAATSISEQTLTFVPKLITVFVVTLLLLPFMMSTMKTFAIDMVTRIISIR